MSNEALAIALLLELLKRAETTGRLLSTAQTENRAITDAEMDKLVSDYDLARQELIDDIAKARGGN